MAGGEVEFRAGFVGHVGLVGEQEGAMQGRKVEATAGLLCLERGLGDLFGDDAAGGTREAVGHDQVVCEDVVGDVQGAGVIAGIDAPEHDGGDHLVLGALAGLQHAGNVRLVGRQQLDLERCLAFAGLDVLQAAAILIQLGELQLIGVRAFHALVRGSGRRLLSGGHAQEVRLGGTEGHVIYSATSMFSTRQPRP